MTDFKFTVRKTRELYLRTGKFDTPHGSIHTPVFMPVGTKATVKAVGPDDLNSIGAQIILANTYHLYLQPGGSLVKRMGGIHKFESWDRPMLTDSGGFQVSSLSKTEAKDAGLDIEAGIKLAKVGEEGVEFRSHLDGSIHFLTPEKSIQIQEDLGADIVMAFDECTPSSGWEYASEAMERTHRWLVRSKAEWVRLEGKKKNEPPQALFGIIQGGDYKDLRRKSARFVVSQDLPGIAIGGDTIGGNMERTLEVVSWIREILPKDKPIYAMGVGTNPQDLFDIFYAGIDMVDCVAPTRWARCGLLYEGSFERKRDKWAFSSNYPKNRIDINKKVWEKDNSPISGGCDCYTCSNFSRGYLHHLFKAKELLYFRLASIHNLRIMIKVGELLRRKM